MQQKSDEIKEDQPLNKKDITAEITGKGAINYDDLDEEETPKEDGNQEEPTNPIVGMMDMFISTSPEMLRRRGYPRPNLDIWTDWGKPNLSKALNAYMPAGTAAGNAVSSPVFAGLIGLMALVIAFMPVILAFMERKKAEKEAKMREMEEQFAVENSPYDEEMEQPQEQPPAEPDETGIPQNVDAVHQETWNKINAIFEAQKQKA